MLQRHGVINVIGICPKSYHLPVGSGSEEAALRCVQTSLSQKHEGQRQTQPHHLA
jgi:hypothetical protein